MNNIRRTIEEADKAFDQVISSILMLGIYMC